MPGFRVEKAHRIPAAPEKEDAPGGKGAVSCLTSP